VVGSGDVLINGATGYVRPSTIKGSTITERGRFVGVAAHFVSSAAGIKDLFVYDHPEQRFIVQASPTVANAGVFLQHVLTWTRSGTVIHCNRTLGMSKHLLGAATTAASMNGAFRVFAVVEGADTTNTTATAYQKVICGWNPRFHYYNGTGASI